MQRLVTVVLLGFVAACGGGSPPVDPDPDAAPPVEIDAAPPALGPLDPGVLHEVEIDIAAGDIPAFDADPSTYVPCTVHWDGELRPASCRKKGYIGSIDAFTGKPAFSIKIDPKLGAFDKLILNNAQQDPSMLHEHVTYEVFRQMGVPAHRTAYALVTINGDPRGIYVALEPVDKEFLRDRYGAGNGNGNLYEGSFCDFVTDPDYMELKDEDEGRTRDDLIAAAAAVRDSPDATFEATVGPLIDLDEFALFFAGEFVVDANDGYAIARNNYYVYHRPDTDQFVFLPHGHDQILDNPGLPLGQDLRGQLAARVYTIAAVRAPFDAALAAAIAPGGALDDDLIAARIDAAVALVNTTTRDDDFTAGDLATMNRWAPVFARQLAWRAKMLRGETEFPVCSDGVVTRNEQCDDGNLTPGDGCDASCFPECYPIAGGDWVLCPALLDRATGAASCATAGGSLVVPADVTEAEALGRMVRRELGSVDFWIGVHDDDFDGIWLTDSGAAPPYIGFTGQEPNGQDDEPCAYIDTGRAGGWRDDQCGFGHAALCRMP